MLAKFIDNHTFVNHNSAKGNQNNQEKIDHKFVH